MWITITVIPQEISQTLLILMVMSYLESLNPVQREAVENTTGPSLIIAGAGSGKTRVLTYRIAHLISQNIDPFNILALTFTNKAAKEMKNRIEQLAGAEAKNLWIGTFHSIFARILRYEAERLGYPSNFTIYDTADSKNLLKTIIKEYNLSDTLYKPNTVLYRISSVKNSLISPEKYLADPDLVSEDQLSNRPKTGLIYSIYAKRCFLAGAMDFDDLLLKMHQLLSQFPEVLYKYQHLFKYILIDEFQDTNYAQYSIVKKLTDVFQNLTVVGDDAQSIYSFRGAVIDNIINFEKDYPDLKTFKLEQNYRSTQNIVDAANAIIANNRNQLKKQLWTQNDSGKKIKLLRTQSDNDEGKIIADAISEEKLRDHIKNEEIAILYRTNAQSRAFEEALRRRNIPYRVYGGLSFYQRKEVKDFISYLRLVVNHNDEEALRRVINYPVRGIGKTSIEKATVLASEQEVSLWNIIENIKQYDIPARTQNAIADFVTMIKSFATMLSSLNAYDLAMHVARSTNLMTELHNDKTVEGLSRYENFQELLNGIKEFTVSATLTTDENTSGNTNQSEVLTDEINSHKSLGTYLQDITLLTDADADKNNPDTVKLMTIHAAKGLEFKSVYIVGLEENLFPSAMSLSSRADLEEERRLFYVAITRAEKNLTLSYANTRYRYGNLNFCNPSRFIEEIPENFLEIKGGSPAMSSPREKREENNFSGSGISKNVLEKFTNTKTVAYKAPADFVADDPAQIITGMEVEHQRFGFGKVVSLEGNPNNKIATIFFQDIGQKKIMLQYAKLRIKKVGQTTDN